MLFRKIGLEIENHLRSTSDKILVVEGARQVGKSYIIREIGRRLFPNFVELNFVKDDETQQLFKEIRSIEDFYLRLSMIANSQLGNRDNTLVFFDEIQHYPQFLTLLKFLREDGRFRYIASGSMLGIALRKTTSIPIGSILIKRMFQLDFEEFLIANGMGTEAIDHMKGCYYDKQSLPKDMHNLVMDHFRKYLLVGGMPDAVNEYLSSHNIVNVRAVHADIHRMYKDDASKYEQSRSRKLLVQRIYDMIPSQMENKKKRIVASAIRGQKGDRFSWYAEEFEYLISSGISLSVNAISNPVYPLCESVHKNLLKLYLNDVGILTWQLYDIDLMPVLNDQLSINLGAVYESAVAQELKAHGHNLFYYDNQRRGEVDYLIDDKMEASVLPVEVKSGKDYMSHRSLSRLVDVPDYGIKSAIVLHSDRDVKSDGKITYMPIYNVMFIGSSRRLDNKEKIIF